MNSTFHIASTSIGTELVGSWIMLIRAYSEEVSDILIGHQLGPPDYSSVVQLCFEHNEAAIDRLRNLTPSHVGIITPIRIICVQIQLGAAGCPASRAVALSWMAAMPKSKSLSVGSRRVFLRPINPPHTTIHSSWILESTSAGNSVRSLALRSSWLPRLPTVAAVDYRMLNPVRPSRLSGKELGP